MVHTDKKSNELDSSETQLTSDVNKDVQSETDLQIVSNDVNVKPTPWMFQELFETRSCM